LIVFCAKCFSSQFEKKEKIVGWFCSGDLLKRLISRKRTGTFAWKVFQLIWTSVRVHLVFALESSVHLHIKMT
jgi:hypothetical protein